MENENKNKLNDEEIKLPETKVKFMEDHQKEKIFLDVQFLLEESFIKSRIINKKFLFSLIMKITSQIPWAIHRFMKHIIVERHYNLEDSMKKNTYDITSELLTKSKNFNEEIISKFNSLELYNYLKY